MSLEEILGIVLGLLAGGGLGWALLRKGKKKDDDTQPMHKPPGATIAIVEVGVDSVHGAHEDRIDTIEDVENSDTPATDAADIINARPQPKEDS